MEDSQREDCGLACPRPGLADEVVALHDFGDGLDLNAAGHLVSKFGGSPDQFRLEAEVVPRDWALDGGVGGGVGLTAEGGFEAPLHFVIIAQERQLTYSQSSALAAIDNGREAERPLKIVEADSDLINNYAELQAHTQGHRSAVAPGNS